MNNSTDSRQKKTGITISIDQCLFGYSHGHRMLYSSRSLPEESIRKILSRTDSPGGNPDEDNATLLQGFPLPELKAYALSRTWPDLRDGARQGTVITHLLLINFVDVGREGIVYQLLRLLDKNPIKFEDDKFLLDTIQFKPIAKQRIKMSNAFNTEVNIEYILNSIYNKFNRGDVEPVFYIPGITPSSPLSLAELTLAAIWEQQWPRLRRAFSFVITDWADTASLANRYTADLTIYSTRLRRIESRYITKSSEDLSWLQALEDDLSMPGRLRQFLRQAGTDVKNPIASVQYLVMLFVIINSEVWYDEKYQKFAKITFQAFPSKSDAKWLKQRVFDPNYWESHKGYTSISFIQQLINLPHYAEIEPQVIDWVRLIEIAKVENLKDLQDEVVTAFDEDDNFFAESFRSEYLRTITLEELYKLIKIRPSLIHAVLQIHYRWLEVPDLWSNPAIRQESLLASLTSLANDPPLDLDWEKVMWNVANASGNFYSSEWIRYVPTNALWHFLNSMVKRDDSFGIWRSVLKARFNEILEWVLSNSVSDIAVLLWICRDIDYMDMWRTETTNIWMEVAQKIGNYPEEYQTELSVQSFCMMLTDKEVEPYKLLNILERVKKGTVIDNLNPRHQMYMFDHLPKLKKSHQNWDLGRRIDIWAAEILNRHSIKRKEIQLNFNDANLSKRLLKLIKK